MSMLNTHLDHLAPWLTPRVIDPGPHWREAAIELAAWSLRFWLLRADRYGRYRTTKEIEDYEYWHSTDKDYEPLGEQTTAYLPEGDDKLKALYFLASIHFDPTTRADIIGFLTYMVDRSNGEPEFYTRALNIDIDNHKDDTHPPINNHRFAITIYKRLQKLGYHPILSDSNGKGGFHCEVSFDTKVECWRVRAIGLAVTRDWRLYGFTNPIEVFPKSIGLTDKEIGGWIRLIGRHHKHEYHWSRIWNGNLWLDGEPAVDYILHNTAKANTEMTQRFWLTGRMNLVKLGSVVLMTLWPWAHPLIDTPGLL